MTSQGYLKLNHRRLQGGHHLHKDMQGRGAVVLLSNSPSKSEWSSRRHRPKTSPGTQAEIGTGLPPFSKTRAANIPHRHFPASWEDNSLCLRRLNYPKGLPIAGPNSKQKSSFLKVCTQRHLNRNYIQYTVYIFGKSEQRITFFPNNGRRYRPKSVSFGGESCRIDPKRALFH